LNSTPTAWRRWPKVAPPVAISRVTSPACAPYWPNCGAAVKPPAATPPTQPPSSSAETCPGAPITSAPMSETTNTDLVATDLTDDERYFVWWALGHWGGCASDAPLPVRLVGAANWDEFDALTDRLATAVKRGEALTDLDWARALFLTEISFGS